MASTMNHEMAGAAIVARLLAGDGEQVVISDGGHHQLTRAGLRAAVMAAANQFKMLGVRRLALLADNGFDWVVVDLAALAADVVVVPIAPFFSAGQIAHLLAAAGIDSLWAPTEAIGAGLGFGEASALAGGYLSQRQVAVATPLPPLTHKITFTSGTTGAPKGVCLAAAAQLAVAESLVTVTAPLQITRHLCLLPLAVLLENIAGIYAPLAGGAMVVVPPLAQVGVQGSSAFAPQVALAAIAAAKAESIVVVPEMLRALLQAVDSGGAVPEHLKFVAVGGGRVSPLLLERALAAGLPVYEGYGLSECASVVALNRPGERVVGTVGRPLPHLQVEVATDGELLIRGNGFLGYLGEPPRPQQQAVATGDLGSVDSQGYLRLQGRRKNLLITSFGRNIAPEWPEAELMAEAEIAQAVVFGDGQPQLVALLVAAPQVSDEQLAMAVARVNSRLPDYARLVRFAQIPPMTLATGLITANGRPRREAVAQAHLVMLNALYPDAMETLT